MSSAMLRFETGWMMLHAEAAIEFFAESRRIADARSSGEMLRRFCTSNIIAELKRLEAGEFGDIEGAVYLNGSQLNTKDLGNVTVEPGQEISTGKGKAEVLLTPGVFLRLDDNSTVKMVSPDLALTQVQFEKGRAGVEVDEIHDQNNLQVIHAGVTTRLNKRGYYWSNLRSQYMAEANNQMLRERFPGAFLFVLVHQGRTVNTP
jgi:hypothetical protein